MSKSGPEIDRSAPKNQVESVQGFSLGSGFKETE
jgi:hypothetical protein